MANSIPMQISVSAVPPNATAENLQELVNLVGQALTVTFPRDASVFGIGNGIPTSYVGLWFSNGSWYYFNDATGKYEPVVLPQSSLRYILSQTAPSRLTYDVWFVLSGSGEPIDVRIWFNNAWTSIYYSRATLDSWFEGLSVGGKAQVDWANVVNKQPYGLIPSGNTAGRSAFETVGTVYFDTQIDAVLIYKAAGWSTVDGQVGDVKHTTAADETSALLRNPGWAIYEIAKGRVLGAAGQGTGLTNRPVGSQVGDEAVTLTAKQSGVQAHSHLFFGENNTNNPTLWPFGASGTAPTLSDSGGGDQTNYFNTSPATEAPATESHSNMQPTLFLVTLVKQF